MAYYLQFDGSNDRVTIQCQATSSESWSIEWQLFAIPTPDAFGFARIFGGSTASESTNRISSQIGGGDISARFAGSNKIWSGKTFTNTDKFRIEYNGSQLELFINDVPSGVIAGTVTANFGLLGCNSNYYTNLSLKYATFTNITTPSKSRDYQPSLSGGVGSVLTDAANGVNGTLVNFPTDNSQWVFYESGDTEPAQVYELTATGGAFSISGAASDINHNRFASAAGVSISYSGSQANAAHSRLISASSAEFSAIGGSASILKNTAMLATGADISYSGAQAELTYSQSATVYEMIAGGVEISFFCDDVGLAVNRLIQAAGAEFDYQGLAAGAFVNRAMLAGGALVSCELLDAALIKSYMLSADGGSYSLSGGLSQLNYSAAVNMSIVDYSAVYCPYIAQAEFAQSGSAQFADRQTSATFSN